LRRIKEYSDIIADLESYKNRLSIKPPELEDQAKDTDQSAPGFDE